MKYKLIKWLEVLCIFLLCLTPLNALFKFNDLYFPYVTSKIFYFRILIEITLCLYLIFRLLTRNWLIQFSKISLFLGVFTLTTFICDYFGENFYQSFWSSSARMDGFISQLHLMIYFLLLPLILNTKQKWIRFFYVHIAVSCLVSIISILQVFEFYPVVSVLRPDSLFGNPTYLSVYSLLNLFLALYLIDESSGLRKIILNAAVSLSVVSIYLSKTRATYLALAIGIVFLLVVYLLNKKKKWILQILSLTAISAGLILGLEFILSVIKNKAPILAERLTESESVYSRYYFWKASLRGFIEHPLLGIGQDNFIYLTPFYDPKMFSEPWFDRSHNFVVDLLVNFGILGTAAYFVFIAAVFIFLNKNKYFDLRTKAIFAAAIIAYLVNNLFLFDFLSGQLVFLSLISYIGFHEGCFNLPKPIKELNFKFKTILTSFLILIGGFWIVFHINIQNILANLELKNILDKKEFFKVVDGKKEVVFKSLLRKKLFANVDVFQNLIQAATLIKGSISDADVYTFVDSEINEFLKNDNKNIYNKYMAATFYANYKNYDQSVKLYKEALNISPNNQEILISFGTMYLSKAEYDNADEKFQIAFDLENSNPNARLYLIASSNFKNNFQKSMFLLNGFSEKQFGYKYDSKIIESFILNKRNDLALSLIEKKCSSGFDCARDYMLLGSSFYNNKQFHEAEVYFNKAISLNPSLRAEALRMSGGG